MNKQQHLYNNNYDQVVDNYNSNQTLDNKNHITGSNHDNNVNDDQSLSSPFQISDLTPSTQLKFYQQPKNSNNVQQIQQDDGSVSQRTYSNTLVQGVPSQQMIRDSTPKRREIHYDQQKNSITPKVGRSSSSRQSPHRNNPHLPQQESQQQQQSIQQQHQQQQQEESRSSFSYFQGLQGSDMKTPGSKLSNGGCGGNKSSFQQDREQLLNNQQISPILKQEGMSSPMVLKGDLDDVKILATSNAVKSGKKQHQKSNKQTNKQGKAILKQSKVGSSQKHSQMVAKNQKLKDLMKSEESNVNNFSQKKSSQNDELLNIRVPTTAPQHFTDDGNNSQVAFQNNVSQSINNNNLSSDAVEAWKYTNNTNNSKDQKNVQQEQSPNASFQDSDIADEFEYLYDPQYLQTRCMSPQTKLNNANNLYNHPNHQPNNEASLLKYHKRQHSSSTQNISQSIDKKSTRSNYIKQSQIMNARGGDGRGSPLRTQFGSNFMRGLEEYEKYELIKRTCKESTKNVDLSQRDKATEFRKRKNNFINRMLIDVQARDNREKTFDEIKYVVAMKTNLDHSSISRSVSPRKERSQNHQQLDGNTTQHHTHNNITAYSPRSNLNENTPATLSNQKHLNHFHSSSNPHSPHRDTTNPIFQSPSTNITNTNINLNLQSPQKKKLRQQDCTEIYNRLMSQEQGRQQAIEMLQEAKRKDEDAEYLQSTGNRKLTKKQKKQCYNRLMQDAERRRVTLQKSQHQQQMQEEQYIRDNQFRARQVNQRKSQNTIAKRDKSANNSKSRGAAKTNSQQQRREVEINIQKYYNQYEDEQEQQQPHEQLISQQQQEYEQYLLQQEEEQLTQDQQEIINIQSQQQQQQQQQQNHAIINQKQHVAMNQKHESSYSSSNNDYIEVDNPVNIFQLPLNNSKPKLRMGSNAMTGVKQQE